MATRSSQAVLVSRDGNLDCAGSSAPQKKKRRSYTREEKLKVVAYYEECGRNLYKTCQHFEVNSKNVLRWLRSEDKIKGGRRGSRRVLFSRRACYPAMEKRLHEEFKELRSKGIKMKGWWFKTRARAILKETFPDSTFKFSLGWFSRFKKRYRVSLRWPTNTAQSPPDDKEAAIEDFHRQIREIQLPGNGDGQQEERFQLHKIANVDQTPLPFSFCSGPTYETTNSSSVWVRSGASGLEKRQCTVQLTIFADGESRVKPFIIFKGTGKRISLKERVQYDARVHVHFQSNAWCDERMMEWWVKNCYTPKVSYDSMLVLDMHRAQKTDHMLSVLDKSNVTPVFVRAGCTGIVQPLDVVFNALFKRIVENTAMKHMQENLEAYMNGKFSASERRVLITQWVGDAWEEVTRNSNVTVCSFKKCRISVAADGSEDDLINIQLTDYSAPQVGEDGAEDTDPFASCESDMSYESSLDSETENEEV